MIKRPLWSKAEPIKIRTKNHSQETRVDTLHATYNSKSFTGDEIIKITLTFQSKYNFFNKMARNSSFIYSSTIEYN